MEIIKTIDDIIAASRICARRNPLDAPKGEFAFEPPYVGYGSSNGQKDRPCWVLKVKDKEKYFVFDEQYEQGRWLSYFDDNAWRKAEDFVYEDRHKEVIFSTDDGQISTKTTYFEKANIALTEKEALRIMNMFLLDGTYRDQRQYSFKEAVPCIKEGLPVWVGRPVDKDGNESCHCYFLHVRYENDYWGDQFGELFVPSMPIECPKKDACYLLSTEYSVINYHQGCPLMAVRFNGVDFEYIPLHKAELK